jgi:hypothetical protein
MWLQNNDTFLSMQEIRLYKRPAKALRIIALTLPFVLAGIWLVSKENSSTKHYITGWLSICFFGLGIPIGLYQLFDKRPQIIITERGIWDRTIRQAEIRWEQIIGAYPIYIHGSKFISIAVDDTYVFRQKQYKWAAAIGEAMGAQRLNLNLALIQIDEIKFTEFINEMRIVHKDYRKVMIRENLENKKSLGY